MKRVCLVSPGHIASNPRLVKEANALIEAGFDVRIIAGDYAEFVRPFDEALLSSVKWTCDRVGLGSRPVYLWRKLKQKIAKILFDSGWRNMYIAMWSHSVASASLAQTASFQAADLYIAHCLAALPAAAIAASKHSAKLGFDAEDFHTGELADIPENQAEIAVRDYIERHLLPKCDYLTAASPMIASAYKDRYRVSIETILNVFPLSEAPKLNDRQKQRSFTNAPSLYWFSQTIGPGRGLESIILAMGQMQTQVSLYLRGILACGYAEVLLQLAQNAGVSDRLHFLPSESPENMARLASDYDVGLSLELNHPFNRSICLTNKIFTYLLASLPVILSKTSAQEDIAKVLSDAAILININDPQSIAIELDMWLSNPANLEKSRSKALQLGREVYNWDIEQKNFLKTIRQVLDA